MTQVKPLQPLSPAGDQATGWGAWKTTSSRLGPPPPTTKNLAQCARSCLTSPFDRLNCMTFWKNSAHPHKGQFIGNEAR